MSLTSHFLLRSPSLATSSPFPRPSKPLLRRFPRPSKPLLRRFPATTNPKFPTISQRPNIKHLACSPTPLTSSISNPFPPLNLPPLTPTTIIKYSLLLALTLTLTKTLVSTLLNPFFWLYFSWTWLFWPWIPALLLTLLALHSLHRHTLGQSTLLQQLSILTAFISWLTLIPPAFFNGFLEGWPLANFLIYHYFFFFEASVRNRLYGDLYPRPHDPKWDTQLPVPFQATFAALVLIGHWLAAYEGPELHMVSGGWANVGTWGLVAVTLFMRYHSVLYLAKYSEKVAVPMEVVQFGPYRWVRHPVYASTMLLFALHCVTLRAPLSLGFLVAVCVWYYGRKAEVEEGLMVEAFGERYTEYAKKVRYKLIPLVY